MAYCRVVPIADSILLQYTGQAAVTGRAAARRVLDDAASALSDARGRLRAAQWSLRYDAIRFASTRWGTPPWVCGFVVGSTAALIFDILLIVLGLASPLLLLIGVLAGYVIVGVLAWCLLDDETGESTANRPVVRLGRWKAAQSRRDRERANLYSAQERYAAAHRLFVNISAAEESAANRLLQVNFNAMTGPQFEQFVCEVCRNIGYEVEHTGQSGDQGIDLIAATPAGRVAIQAKCYSGSVGNAAIQEAYAGMKYYGCQGCVVITNSTFTRSARDLAGPTECILIDGSQIEALIRRKISLEPALAGATSRN